MPPLRETESILREAMETGEILTIAYHGGSHPGTQRQIAPIRLQGDLVLARCYITDRVKAFRIKRIQVFENNTLVSKWDPQESIAPISSYHDLCDFLEHNEHELLTLGWHVIAHDEEIALFRRFKNGKPLKHPDVSIQYLETIDDGYYDTDMNYHSEKKKRARPWVISLRQGGTAFGHLDRAVDRFMLEARKHAPIHR
jgi:hypothetical protein